jgi:hypothetical protein
MGGRYLAIDNIGFFKRGFRFAGTFEALNKCLQVVQRYLDMNKVIVLVQTDSKEVIKKLINACLECKDHRGTLGIYPDRGFVLSKQSQTCLLFLNIWEVMSENLP